MVNSPCSLSDSVGSSFPDVPISAIFASSSHGGSLKPGKTYVSEDSAWAGMY